MPPPHPCWLASFLMLRKVGCLRRLAGPASLEDWGCSCLCSELIPSVTEISALFVKELLFPQTAPTDDAFFNRNWAGACWNRWAGTGTIVGPVRRLWTLDSSTKTRKKEGRQGLHPWLLRCLSQFLLERKDRLLRGRMFLRTFHRWGDLIFIVYVFPNWMMVSSAFIVIGLIKG